MGDKNPKDRKKLSKDKLQKKEKKQPIVKEEVTKWAVYIKIPDLDSNDYSIIARLARLVEGKLLFHFGGSEGYYTGWNFFSKDNFNLFKSLLEEFNLESTVISKVDMITVLEEMGYKVG